jgi:amino acid transporter
MENARSKDAATSPRPRGVSTVAATAIGVGGMMGAGLYTLVGLAATTAGVLVPLSFCVAAVVALFSVYSYAKLGTVYPSRGGAATFLIAGFGNGIVSGGLNIFQFLGWIIAMGLYAAGFAGYAGDLLPWHLSGIEIRLVAVGIIAVLLLVNLVGTSLVGRSEMLVVAVELVILVVFVVLGITTTHTASLDVHGGDGPIGVLFGAGLLYVTFEGFGVVTNSAGEMAHPARQLPRAMYGALGVVLAVYVAVSTIVVLVLPLAAIDANQGHVLAEAGRAIAGRVGFVAIAVAALLATASAVNATLFGDANLAAQVAAEGQLPAALARPVVRAAPLSTFVAAGLTMMVVLVFPLSAVGQMASLAFLIVYGAVSLGHLRIREKTGARRGLLLAAVVLNAALFVLLLAYTLHTGPISTPLTLLGTLVASFVVSALVRRRRTPAAASSPTPPMP